MNNKPMKQLNDTTILRYLQKVKRRKINYTNKNQYSAKEYQIQLIFSKNKTENS